MTATTDETLAEKIDRLTAVVHQLERVVRSKLSPPVDQLTYAQAVKAGFARKELEQLVAEGVFTDHRGMKRRGAPVKLYADELQALRSDGPAGVRRLREQLGRD